MRNILKWPVKKLPDWFMTLVLGLVLIIALVPIYRLAIYSFPYYDDYFYGITIKNVLKNGGGLWDILKGAYSNSMFNYYHWQGTYASIFIMTLMPASFGYQYYSIGIFVIITMLVIGTMYLTYTVAKCVFNASRINAFNLALYVTFMNVQLFHEAQQGIYWYNSSLHYTFMHSLMFVLLAGVIRMLYTESKASLIAHMILDTLLAFAIGGSNFITTLQGILIILFVFLIGLYGKKKRALCVLPTLIVYIAGLIINVTAPGNDVRQSVYGDVAKEPVDAVLLSFVSAVKNLGIFTGFPFWALVVGLIPFCFAVGFKANIKFRFPALVTIFSFCFYATGYTPSWYGMGHEGLARTFCVIKMGFIVLFAFNLVYWAGWIKGKVSQAKAGKIEDFFSHRPLIYIVCVSLFVVSFLVSTNQAGNFFSYGAYYYIHTGEALNYYNEHLAIAQEIDACEDDVVELDPIVWQPWFLCKKNEIDTNPLFEQNQALAQWHGKTAIYTKE